MHPFIKSLIIILILGLEKFNISAHNSSAFNNPFLSFKDCSGVIINDTTLTFDSQQIYYGDGSPLTSLLFHQYYNSGSFIVKYFRIASGLVIDSFIDTLQIVLVAPPVFTYHTIIIGYSYGMTQFNLNTIHKTSGYLEALDVFNPSYIFADFTCSDQTTLQEGIVYPVTATTDTNITAFLSVFLDANANGEFERSEIIGQDMGFINHSFNITIPKIIDSLLNIPLRLRVVCTTGSIPFNSTSGQYGIEDIEDYTVLIQNNLPNSPHASFQNYHACDGLKVQFINTSTGAPDSVKWYFPDGTSSNSFVPQFIYSRLDSQTVDLIAYNSFGIDTIHSEIDNPIYPDIIPVGPIYTNQIITFQTAQFPNITNWWWTFPDVPIQFTTPIAYHSYTNPGAYPVTFSMLYEYTDIFSESIFTCNTTRDDTVFIVINGINDFENKVSISLGSENSTHAILRINSEFIGKFKVRTTNISSQLEKEFSFIKTEENFSGEISFINSGIYLVLVEINNKLIVRKFISVE